MVLALEGAACRRVFMSHMHAPCRRRRATSPIIDSRNGECSAKLGASGKLSARLPLCALFGAFTSEFDEMPQPKLHATSHRSGFRPLEPQAGRWCSKRSSKPTKPWRNNPRAPGVPTSRHRPVVNQRASPTAPSLTLGARRPHSPSPFPTRHSAFVIQAFPSAFSKNCLPSPPSTHTRS